MAPRNCKCGGRYKNTSTVVEIPRRGKPNLFHGYDHILGIAEFECDSCGKIIQQKKREAKDNG